MQTQSSTQEMIKELKEVKSVFNQCEQSELKSYSHDLEQQAQLDLAMVMTMSLEVDWVVNKFMEYVHAYFLFDGFHYQCSEPQINIEYARMQGHSCRYNLELEDFNLGTLTMYRGRKFAESELMLFENLIALLVHPLRNSIQYKKATLLAYSDALTGARNRSTFDESLMREVNLSKRHQQELALLVVDIDYFKKVNDTYGHSAGDQALKAVAESIQQSIRTTDLLFRYGGEEFVVFLSKSDCESAYVIANRILESVRELNVQVGEEFLDLSVSIGLSCLTSKDTGDSIFNRADKALYQAKNDGRDQIKVA